MKRKDREMDKKFALHIIDEKSKYSVVSMILPDGTPYCVPLSIIRIENSLYFHCAAEGLKITALSTNPQVCVSFVGDVNPLKDKFTTEYESAIVKGKAFFVSDVQEKINALKAICLHYTPENMSEFDISIEKSLSRTFVVRIDIDEITAKRKKYDTKGIEMKFGRME